MNQIASPPPRRRPDYAQEAVAVLRTAVDSLLDAERLCEDLEAQLKAARNSARILREETVPGIMNELGVKTLTLDDGAKVELKLDVHARISDGDKPIAFEWLVNNGYESLIRSQVTVKFDKGDMARAEALVENLRGKGIDAKNELAVHPQTLKVLLREELSSGRDVPLDAFGATCIWAAKVKL